MSRLDLDRSVDNLLRADRLRTAAILLPLMMAITLADHHVELDVWIGALYVLPVMMGAIVFPGWMVVLHAVLCAGLRSVAETAPSPTEGVIRFLFASTAYAGSGILVAALIHNRKLAIERAHQLTQQEVLRRNLEDQLRMLIDSSPAAIFTLDEQGVVLVANHAANQLLGYDGGSSVVGRSLDAHLPLLADALRCRPDPGPFRTAAQCQGTRRNGEPFQAHMWFSIFDHDGKRRLAAIVVDTSEEMRAREQRALRGVSESIRITASVVAHEMRNLCGALALLYSSLQHRPVFGGDEEFQKFGGIIGSLKRIASYELTSRAANRPLRASLKEVLADLRIIIEPDWTELGGTIAWHLPASLPVVVGEPHGLLQVFLNLAQNALRAVQAGGELRLAVECETGTHSAKVRFIDSGTGVSSPELLFQPFQENAAATGLGLHVSRSILRSFGGDLAFVPRSAGACFEVHLQLPDREHNA